MGPILGIVNPLPQQGDSNLGWVGGHQWSQSWRERRPPTRPPFQVCWLGPEPQGTQVTPLCHQMGRHPTIWDIGTGILRRIPARILLWGSWVLNPNFLPTILDPQIQGLDSENGFHLLRATASKWVCRELHRGSWAPHWAPSFPRGHIPPFVALRCGEGA